MDRFRAAIDELVDKVKEAINGEPKSPVEFLLDEHLSLDDEVVTFSPKNCTAVAIPTGVMNDFAARTRNIVDYPFIMERVWEILVDHQHNPVLMKKALNLLLYMLVNGAIQVLKDCQESIRMTYLQNLAEDYNRYEFEQYKFSQHLDVGAGVRKTATDILQYLTNERELFQARSQAEVLHQKLADRGLRSSSSSSLGPSSPSSMSDSRPPQYTDSYSPREDIGLKIVTHPDELFDEPSRQTRAMTMPPVHKDRCEGDTSETTSNPSLTTKRGHSRKEKRRESAGDEHTQRPPKPRQTPPPPPPANENVDLLGLEALGLESLIAAPKIPEAPATLPRSQSARLAPPQQFSATI